MALFTQEGTLFILRWIHFMAGITWIGMLYYFNLVQTPFLATELGGQARSAVVRGILPNAMWWFRWGAMFTFLSGWSIIFLTMAWGLGNRPYYTVILTGGLMGTIMWANVWFVIWPIQKLVIASAEGVAKGGQADPQAAARAPFAGRASRTNTAFSIPMLFFMGAARHLSVVNSENPHYFLYWLIVLALFGAFEANPFYGNAATQKFLSTVSGTIHGGLGFAAVLWIWAAIAL